MKKDLEARRYTQGGNLLERRRPTLYCVPTCCGKLYSGVWTNHSKLPPRPEPLRRARRIHC